MFACNTPMTMPQCTGLELAPPRQRKAAVTAVALSIPAVPASMSRVRHRAAPKRSVLEANGPLRSAQTGIEHMTLITAAQRQKLLENGRAQRDAIDRQDQVLDFEPVVKLFTADGNATGLLTELNPDIDLAFGLCDLGLGQPELGYVSLQELAAARGPLGLPLECDRFFTPTRTIAAYADLAREHRRIIT